MKTQNAVNRKGLNLLYTEGDKSFYSYTPTVFRPLYTHFEPMTISRRVRLLLERLGKNSYKVFYLEVSGVLVGHCVVAPGGRRLGRSTERDIVLGPYFVDPSHRGKGYAKDLIQWSLHKSGLQYDLAYDYIKKDNHPSRKATLACGFTHCGELDIRGFFHTLVECSGGEYDIFSYDPGER